MMNANMIDLSAIGKKESKVTREYPVLPDETGEMREIVDTITPIYEQLEALNGSLEAMEAELKQRAAAYWIDHYNGRSDAPTQLLVEGSRRRVAVQLKDQYPGSIGKKLDAITSIIGEDAVARLFERTFKIEIDGKKIPTQNAQRFVNGLVQLASVFCYAGGGEQWETFSRAIEDTLALVAGDYPPADAVSAVAGIRPIKGTFHIERHKLFTAEQNRQLHRVMPMQTALKKKGVK